MALDFPTSPALNQVYTFGSYSWRWDGTSWVGAVPIVNATINNTTIGAVTPSTGAFTTLSATTPIASSSGGTGNGFAKFSGPASSEKTFTLPNASSTLLYEGGTIGATTANTGAFTTLNTSGTITSTATGDILSSIAATTTEKFSRFNNTGGATKWGTESSAGGTIFIGTTAYASVFGSALNNPVQIASNNSVVGTFTSTGLNSTAIGATTASTGAFTTLSATGTIGLATNNTAFQVKDTGGTLRTAFLMNASDVFTIGTTNNVVRVNSYDLELNAQTGRTVAAMVNGSTIGSFSSTGLAVTGTLGTSDNITITKATSAALILDSTNNTTSDITQVVYRRNGTIKWRAGVNIGATSTENYSIYSETAGAIALFSTTGAAVTGALSATTTITGTGITASAALRASGAVPSNLTSNSVYDFFANTSRFFSFGDVSTEGQYLWYTALGAASPTQRMGLTSTGLTVIGALSNTGSAIFGNSSAPSTSVAGTQINNPFSVGPSIFSQASATGNRWIDFMGSSATLASFTNDSGVFSIQSGGGKANISSSGLAVTGTSGADGSVYSGNVNFAVSSGTTDGSYITNAGKLVASANGDDSLRLRRRSSDGSTALFYRDTTNVGNISVTTVATTFNSLSDYRRKSNVQDLTGSGTFIDALKPRTFDWDSGDKGVGFIAHEFAEVSPSSVAGEKDAVDSDGKPVYQAMQASSAEVIANLVAELQSLRQRVAALESSN